MTKNDMIKAEDMHVRSSVYPSEGVKRYLPEVRVSFHTDAQCYQASGRKLVRGEVRDPTYQLLSVSTTKTLASPAGSFNITLAGDQWADRLTPNDLVVIRMGYMGQENLSTVMIGLIDRVRTRRTAQGGQPSVTTEVVGRDFGKMLLKSQLKFYPEIGAQQSAQKYFLTEQGWIDMLGIFTEEDFVEGTPNIILGKIMTEILPRLNETVWTVYDESKTQPTPKKIGVRQLMGYQFEETDFFIPFYLTADTFEGSLWNLMERAIQKPFTELFVDTVDSYGIISETNITKGPVTSNAQPPTTQANTTQADVYHTVAKGESLWEIAGKHYRNNAQWKDIWEANKELLIARDSRNNNQPGQFIYPGQKLRVPNVKASEAPIKQNAPTQKAYPTETQNFGHDNGKVMVTYRMTPFDASNWNSLPKHTLEAVDVLSEDIGRSDEEHYNVFWAGSTVNPLGDMNIRMVSPPKINLDHVKRYGISPLEVEIEGLAIKREKEAEHKVALENLSDKYSVILKAWYENNHKFYEGTVLTRGIGSYRIGQRLEYKPYNIEAYIEGVTQSFNVFTDWTTSLTITRGVKLPEGNKTNSKKDLQPPSTVTPTTPTQPNTPPPVKKASEAVSTDQYYTVVKGDTLWAIATKYYKQGSQWGKIWEANKTMLIARDKRNASDPGHWIYPGQKLRIPKN